MAVLLSTCNAINLSKQPLPDAWKMCCCDAAMLDDAPALDMRVLRVQKR
jgi:hypothetical protein